MRNELVMLTDLKEIQALDLWRRTVVSSVRLAAPDLTARQMALLLNVYLTPPRTPCAAWRRN